MEVLTLLVMLLPVSGYPFVLQPRPTFRQIAVLDRETLHEMKTEQLKDVSIFAEEKETTGHHSEGRKTEKEHRNDGLTPETNPEKMEEKITAGLARNEGEVSKGYEEGNVDRLTPGTFAKSLEGEKKRDMEKDLDKDKGDEVETGEDLKTNEEGETVKESLTDNTKTGEAIKIVNSPNMWIKEKDDETLLKKRDQMDEVRREIEEEESELVAGIILRVETGGDAHEGRPGNEEKVEEKRGNEEREKREEEGGNRKNTNHNESVERGKEDHMVRNVTPPLSTSSTQPGEITATIQIITQSPNPPNSPPHNHHHVPPSVLVTPTQVPRISHHPPTPHAEVSPQFFPPSVTLHNPTTMNHISITTVAPGGVRSMFEDLLTEVLQSPGHQLKRNEQEGNASPSLEDVMVENVPFKPEQKEPHTTREIHTTVQPEEAEFIPKVQAAKRKPTKVKLTSRGLKSKGSNSTSKAYVEFAHKPHMARHRGKPDTGKLMENDTKRNKAAPPQPQLNTSSTKTQLTTAKTPSTRPTKINRSSQNKTNKKSKEKKRKKDNKTKKLPEKKEVITPTHFPYFLDDYCPPECACYGRVVQCSDKGVDKVPYGIPYNARYILLMNNHINSIQLDLLNEYVSMEFLVLSNNRLTDGAIEGAFEGIPALKRLYLDRNLLESVPTDLPVSLEELRLDNNQLRVMSEAAWSRCPGLLVLSLSNNSLGNGSDSLPNAALSPLSSLRTLNLDHNQLTSVPLGLPLSIKELYLKGNLIEQFRGGAFNGISEMVVLDLSANRLTNKGLLRESLLNATHLESLNLEGNKLKQVPRHLPHSLKTLNLEGNLISSIKKAALSILKNLEHLGLARNKIIKVAPGAFKALPVLHQLDLCHNTLRQVPRQLPQALHSVALTHNKIRSVPRDAFCWGDKSLSLSGLVRVQLEHNLIDMGKLDVQAFRCLRGFQVVHFY